MKSIVFILVGLLCATTVMAKDSGGVLQVKKMFAKKEKIHTVEVDDADEWPLSRLFETVGAGEDEMRKYGICFQGNTKDVMEIIEAIVDEENKNLKKGQRERKIFTLELSGERFKGYPEGSIILELGWKGGHEPNRLHAFQPCKK